MWIPVADETRAVAALREEGIAVAPGALYRIATPPAIRVTTATLPVGDARRVAEAIRASDRDQPGALVLSGKGRQSGYTAIMSAQEFVPPDAKTASTS